MIKRVGLNQQSGWNLLGNGNPKMFICSIHAIISNNVNGELQHFWDLPWSIQFIIAQQNLHTSLVGTFFASLLFLHTVYPTDELTNIPVQLF